MGRNEGKILKLTVARLQLGRVFFYLIFSLFAFRNINVDFQDTCRCIRRSLLKHLPTENCEL